MSEAATTAMALAGSCAASFVLLCAYSTAVMPGVTVKKMLVSLARFSQYRSHAYVLQLAEDVDESREVAGRNEAQLHLRRRNSVGLENGWEQDVLVALGWWD